MPKITTVTALCLFAILGLSTSVRSEDSVPKKSSAEHGKPLGWKDPQPAPNPLANSNARSHERRSALEERVRYLEEQAATMARDLEAERRSRAALETSAEAAKRETDELKAKIRADEQRARKATLAMEPSKSRERETQTVKTLKGNKSIVRSSFSLPGALRPIRF